MKKYAPLLLALSLTACTPQHTEPTTQPTGILTPPAPHSPRINGARIYGQRPNAPFLFTIPATGDRPMKFSAAKLPPGLTLDPATGRITGSVSAPGTYQVQLTASNHRGKSKSPLKIVIGDRLALTPPMGWNSWNSWAKDVDQQKVLASAQAMHDSGLINHGWTYVNTDDAWQGKRGGPYNAIQPNEKFPDFKSMADQIHAMGLKVGIYSTPWITSYAGFLGGSSDNPDGAWDPATMAKPAFRIDGKYPFADNDAKQWADWGVDYLKYDWNPRSKPVVADRFFHTQTQTMAAALKNSGRDIVFSYSNSMPLDRIEDQSPMLNAWRTTGDIRDTWSSLTKIGFSQYQWTANARPGHWNDPDMLVVGNVGWSKNLHPSKLTHDEQYTHISLWCLLSAPLLIGCPLERLDPFTLSLLTNDEVLAVDQDPLGHSATLVAQQGDRITFTHTRTNRSPETQLLSPGQVWAKDLEDGSKAVGLFNLSDHPLAVHADFHALHLTGRQSVRDLWRQKNLPKATDQIEYTIPAHGVLLLKLTPA